LSGEVPFIFLLLVFAIATRCCTAWGKLKKKNSCQSSRLSTYPWQLGVKHSMYVYTLRYCIEAKHGPQLPVTYRGCIFIVLQESNIIKHSKAALATSSVMNMYQCTVWGKIPIFHSRELVASHCGFAVLVNDNTLWRSHIHKQTLLFQKWTYLYLHFDHNVQSENIK
jgi:hypothetical protein